MDDRESERIGELGDCVHYFAYGSNMSRSRLAARIGAVRASTVAALPGMRFVCNKPGRDGSGKANVVRCAASCVWGVVYTLRADALGVLDAYEPGYSRELHRVRRADGAWAEAQLYRWPGPGAALPAAAWYRALLVEGALEHALPEDHRRVLEALEVIATSRPGDV